MKDLKLPSPEEIQEWLDEIGCDRQWLAEQIGAALPTVSGWLAKNKGRAIPEPTHRLICHLMRTNDLGEILFTFRETQKIRKAMNEADYHSFPEFARDAVIAKTEEISLRDSPVDGETNQN